MNTTFERRQKLNKEIDQPSFRSMRFGQYTYSKWFDLRGASLLDL